MDLGLEGKVAIVTGGSAGIGLAAARTLAREGARVVIVARTASTLAEAAGSIREDTGGEVVDVAADVSKDADIERLFAATLERFGRLDVLVNNAGKSHAAPLMTVTRRRSGKTTSISRCSPRSGRCAWRCRT